MIPFRAGELLYFVRRPMSPQLLDLCCIMVEGSPSSLWCFPVLVSPEISNSYLALSFFCQCWCRFIYFLDIFKEPAFTSWIYFLVSCFQFHCFLLLSLRFPSFCMPWNYLVRSFIVSGRRNSGQWWFFFQEKHTVPCLFLTLCLTALV